MSAPPRIVVIGGGFAGIAAGVDLARRGARVTLVEARRTLGGRASSFVDPESGETIDDGQHLLMGCYTATRHLLRALGTEHLVRFQKRLAITMIDPENRATRLLCPPLPSPAHLLCGLLAMKGVTWADRISLLRAARSLMHLPGDGLTVEEWLDRLRITENLRRRFWRPIAIAALNEDTRAAAASLLTSVLKTAFGRDASATGLGIPLAGMSDLHAEPATRFITERGGEVRAGAPASEIKVEAGRATAVILRDGDVLPCDAVVLAVPHTAAGGLLPREALDADGRLARLGELGSSAIVSVNLWFDRPVTEHEFFGLVGGTIQFIFNKRRQWDQRLAKGTYLAGVVSAASGLATGTNEVISNAAVEEIRRYLPASRGARLLRSMVVREKQATFSGRPGVLDLRPGPATAISNLTLAGDWTATGLPGTIESAVLSGYAAAHNVPTS